MNSDETSDKVLNVRGMPADLMWELREAAAILRVTIRQFVIDAIRDKVQAVRNKP